MESTTMTDYIKREEAINAFDDPRVDRYYGDVSPSSVIEVIETITAADVVEVVRCRDCKYWNANLKQCFHKTAPGMWRKDTFFCANGERKTKING